jgi:hypothetical protein
MILSHFVACSRSLEEEQEFEFFWNVFESFVHRGAKVFMNGVRGNMEIDSHCGSLKVGDVIDTSS